MKEQVTKFDINAAFKALDELNIPVVKGIRANRMNLKESVKKVDRTSLLIEDFYDVNDQEELRAAKEEREAEVAKAKLARIEKIVDLDAETEEDLQPSYVGKTIIQCPQCMTLFYKNAEDLIKDESDPETVNVNEPCQHCGNTSGYMVIGKVDRISEEESDQFSMDDALDLDFVDAEDNDEESTEGSNEESDSSSESTDATSEEDPNDDLINTDESEKTENTEKAEEPEEKKEDKDESFVQLTGSYLREQVKKALKEDLDDDMQKYNEYIKYLQAMLKQDKEALEEAKKMKDNDFAIKVIEKRIAADKEDLEAALPNIVKDKQAEDDLPEPADIPVNTNDDTKEKEVEDKIKESVNSSKFQKNCKKSKFKAEKSDYLSLNEEKESDSNETIKESAVKESSEAEKLLNDFAKSLDEDLETEIKLAKFEQSLPESCKQNCEESCAKKDDSLTESNGASDDVSDAEFRAMLNNPIFYESLHESASLDAATAKCVAAIEKAGFGEPADSADTVAKEQVATDNNGITLTDQDTNFDDVEEIYDEGLNKHFTDYLTEVYSNVKNFTATACTINENKLIIEGVINFNSGNARHTTFTFFKEGKTFKGINEDMSNKTAFEMNCSIKGKWLIVEGLKYSYTINNTLVEGLK